MRVPSPKTVRRSRPQPGWIASLADAVFGRPLASSEERAQRISSGAGVPIFGLDALSSAAYGPEAALTLLIPLGVAGVAYILPISLCIIILLFILFFSYRQTIAAYPTGGGSYIVAGDNLGPMAALVAGAALMIDYILTAAVGISAGVGALVSADPSLQPHTLALCLLILLGLTVVNLRGVREVGAVFMVPTYLFIGTLVGTIVVGLLKAAFAGGHPAAVVSSPPPHPVAGASIGPWLLLQAFASGCTAMTGVEAVSNGVRAFREPVVKSAQRTLTIVIVILAIMLAGIALLVRAYHIVATPPGRPGYESVLSMLVAAVAGRNCFYYITIGSVLLVLALSANTAFADFPRLCRAIAEDGYLPSSFGTRGRRLVYSQGIWVLAIITALLLILFGGVTDRLIPLFAIGAFLAFTLSQAGMVMHWWRKRGLQFRRNILVNGLGAVATAITVIVVVMAKFVEGAWVTVLLIPSIIFLMLGVRRHYDRVEAETAEPSALNLRDVQPPLAVVPVLRWGKVTQKALTFALNLSQDIVAVHVECGKESQDLQREWPDLVEAPAKKRGLPPPRLITLKSPYRYIITPILDYVLKPGSVVP
ncbi:MAG: APC family permease, partial [Acidobacteria bacterium]|nr:APC family permease [Acidobacteriota bacterium]